MIIEDLRGKDIPKCCGNCVNFRMANLFHNIGYCAVNGMERFYYEPNEKCSDFYKRGKTDGNQN